MVAGKGVWPFSMGLSGEVGGLFVLRGGFLFRGFVEGNGRRLPWRWDAVNDGVK